MTNAGLTGTPMAVAGSAFALSAAAGVSSGYDGTPVLDVSKVVDHNGVSIAGGTLSGTFSAGTGAAASGAGFKYLDVGNVHLVGDAVVDSGFSSVDQTTDCVAGSTSNTLSSGQYGCNIGSADSVKFGRWYPSHYSFSGALTPGCAAGMFTYMGQDALGVALTLKAHASTGAAPAATDPIVSRYTYAPGYTNLASVTLSGDNNGSAVAVSRLDNPAFPSMPNATLWVAGLFTINDTFAFSRQAAPDGPFELFKLIASVNDPDGSSLIGTNAQKETNATRIRYGRLWLGNAYGSELLDLPIPLEAQYWAAGGYYVTNRDDVCTTIPVSSIALSFLATTPNLVACETQLSPMGSPVLVGGKLPLKLTKPGKGNNGTVGLALNIGSAAVGSTCVSSSGASTPATAASLPWFGIVNPAGRAAFGVFKTPLIYRRENY
jgi:MSHA biogenesis protein MshQ